MSDPGGYLDSLLRVWVCSKVHSTELVWYYALLREHSSNSQSG